MKVFKGIGIGMIVLAIIYLLGPQAEKPVINNIPTQLDLSLKEVSAHIDFQEEKLPFLKTDNEARVIWADSALRKTEYAIVYLHGFSASQGEGAPIHTQISKKYGANLYLSRLEGHGTNEPEPFINLSVEKLVSTAKEAIAIGKLIGEKVILMSCSTGGTLSLYLAAGDPEIAGLVLYSPNIDLYDKKTSLLTSPWGLQIARLISGGNQIEFEQPEEMKKYWTTKYRLEGVVQLKLLLEATMIPKVFKKISQPTFVGYYYKNEHEQDKVVSIKKILDMYNKLGTVDSLKHIKAFSEVGYHALNSQYRSKDLISVKEETSYFLEKIMGLTPKSLD